MVCLKCSMENDFSRPISVIGLHTKYLTMCHQMFLVFEKKLLKNGHAVEPKDDGFSWSSVVDQGSLSTKSYGKNVVVQRKTRSDESSAVKTVNKFFEQQPSPSPFDLQPSKDENDHISDKSTNKKAHKRRKGRHKFDRVSRVIHRPIRYIDNQLEDETFSETMCQLEQFKAKYKTMQELKLVPDLKRHMPLPDMPLMRSFKVYRPAEGEPWPPCHGVAEDEGEPTVTHPTNTPTVIKTFRSNLRISSYELFDDRDCTLFPELDVNDLTTPSFSLGNNNSNQFQHKTTNPPILSPFCPSESNNSRRYCDARLIVPAAQLHSYHKDRSAPDVNHVQTHLSEPIRNINVKTRLVAPKVDHQKTGEDCGQTVNMISKRDNAVGGSYFITSNEKPTLACHNADDDNSNFRESRDSNEEASNDYDDSGNKSEFAIYVAEYLAKFVPDLDETLKSFLARYVAYTVISRANIF